MGKFVKWISSVWSVILITSILLFVFWGGLVFSAASLGHGGRLIISYTFIPVAVAVVLLWRRRWEWGTFVYYTLGIALVKMVITMGIYMSAAPRHASGVAKPIDEIAGATPREGRYRELDMREWGHVSGRVIADDPDAGIVVAIADITAGKAQRRSLLKVGIMNNTAAPRVFSACLGDSLSVANHDGMLHTFSVTGTGGSLFQLPLAPSKMCPSQVLSRNGFFTSHCAQGHQNETTEFAVFSHPYHTIASADGTFRLDSIPPGDYHIEVYRLDGASTDDPEAQAEIRVNSMETSTVEINLSGK